MKTVLTIATIAALAAAGAPALAQSAEGGRTVTGYGTLGYSHTDRGVSDLGGVAGRLGLRFGPYVGVEGEAIKGVTDDDRIRGGVATETKLERSMAAYAVGYVPVSPRLDLIGRVGLGNTRTEIEGPGARIAHVRQDTINYGVGAQYFMTAKDGLRADYTRESVRKGPGRADTYALSYVRKF